MPTRTDLGHAERHVVEVGGASRSIPRPLLGQGRTPTRRSSRTDGTLITLAANGEPRPPLFRTTTMNRHMFRTMVAGGFAAASLTAAAVALASPAAATAATSTSQPDVNAATVAASQQGIIMSDGRICNPRWGC